MTTALARAHLFYRFDAFASRNGIDFDRLLAAEGLGRKDLAEPDNEIPLNAAAQVLNNAAMECGDPCLGVHWAENYPSGASGVLGYVFPNCPTVRDAVKALARFQPLIVDPLDASFHEADGVGRSR